MITGGTATVLENKVYLIKTYHEKVHSIITGVLAEKGVIPMMVEVIDNENLYSKILINDSSNIRRHLKSLNLRLSIVQA